MANVLAVVSFAVGFLLLHTGLLVWLSAMLPGPVLRAKTQIEFRPFACFAWGTFLVIGACVAFAFALPQRDAGFRAFADLLAQLAAVSSLDRFSNDARILTHVAAWIALGPLMAVWAIGGAGFARLFADRTAKDSTWSTAVGGLTLSASYLFPFVGWFVFLPAVGAMSVGAGAMALVLRRSPGGKGAIS